MQFFARDGHLTNDLHCPTPCCQLTATRRLYNGREREGGDSGVAISEYLCNLKIRGKGRNEKGEGAVRTEEQRAVSRSRVRSRDVDDLQFETRGGKKRGQSVSQSVTK